jgi:flagellar biosynthesis protein FlhB
LPDYIELLLTASYGLSLLAYFFIEKETSNMRKEQIITTNNNQMEEKGMKSRFIHFKKRFVPALSGALMGVMLMSTTCFAAGTGTSAVTQPLENLKTLIIAVIGAVGVIILAKNVMEFAQAYQQQDSSTMNSALKGIVAGVMMAGISTVLTFLGF